MGDGRDGKIIGNRDRMQAAMLHRPDIDGTGSGSLLDSILSALL